jgi:ketosteroid isomerase-like protein
MGSQLSNSDVVREAFEAGERRDKQALFGLLSPNVEWHMAGLFPDEPPVRTGREGIWEYTLMLFETIEGLHRELTEVEEVGNDQVVARYHVSGTSRDSGTALDFEFTMVARVRDGKIVSGRNYEDHDEAVTDAQLAL